MMPRNIVVIFYLLLVCPCLFGQETTLTVVDDNAEPVAFAAVLKGDDQFVDYTDAQGQLTFSVSCTAQLYSISFFGYETKQVTLPCDRDTNLVVRLSSSIIELKTLYILGANENEQVNKPYQIATLTGRTLKEFQSQSTVDALEQQGGAFVQRSQMGGGSPILRGFEANKVLLVVDGIRLNNAIYRSGHLQNALSVDQSILGSISVLYGPGSIVYGSDALGGVMHFQTQRPAFGHSKKFETKGGYYARYATANAEKAGHIHLNVGNNRIASLTSISYRDFDDLRAGANYPDAYPDFGKRTFYVNPDTDEIMQNDDVEKQVFSGYNQLDILQKLSYKINAEEYIGINVQYSTTSDVPRYDELTITNVEGLPEKAEWYYGPQNRFLAAIRYDGSLEGALADRIEIQGAYQYIAEDRHQRNFLNPNLRSNYETVDVYGLQADFWKDFDKGFNLSYGVEYRLNQVASKAEQRNIETGEISQNVFTRYPSGGSEMHDLGIYALGQRNWNRWTAQLGGRLNYNEINVRYSRNDFFTWPTYFYDGISQSNTAATWLAGLNYAISGDTHLRFFTGTAFRAPNVDDFAKVRVRTSRSISIPNPTLVPEKTWNAELGIQHTWRNKSDAPALQIGLTGYYTHLTDAIIRQPFALPNGDSTFTFQGNELAVQANVNADKGYIIGLSAQVKATLSPSLTFDASVSQQRGRSTRNEDDLPLAHIPPLYGQATVTYALSKVRFSIKSVFNAKKDIADFAANSSDNAEFATPEGSLGWQIVNVYANFSIHDNLDLKLSAENIFDLHYRTFSSGISAAGRNIKVGVYGNF